MITAPISVKKLTITQLKGAFFIRVYLPPFILKAMIEFRYKKATKNVNFIRWWFRGDKNSGLGFV